MSVLRELIERGGFVMILIMALSVVLYAHCFDLLLSLRQNRPPAELEEEFARRRPTVGAMIAAAPLLGLLGTVSGMARTFENLARRSDQQGMENLAGGISQVLVTTESGLAVALPALLFVYLAHRSVQKQTGRHTAS